MKQRKVLFPMAAKALGERQVETIISTGSTDREGGPSRSAGGARRPADGPPAV